MPRCALAPTRQLARGVKNEEKRQRLTPNYRIGCKRILISNDYFPALDRPNVAVVTTKIADVRADAIVTVDGRTHPADCIIFGTGFTATDLLAPMRIVGRAGKDLRASWRVGASAHLGMTVAGFPNFFMLYGPNTGLAHNSIVFMLEAQIRYVVACLTRLARGETRTLEVRADVQQRFDARLQRRLARTIWAKGCASWYLTPEGRNATNWPGYTFEFAWRTRRPRWSDYVVG
jgi:cation diffusion facilitator CzcD-associated flavoprotein CzcO